MLPPSVSAVSNAAATAMVRALYSFYLLRGYMGVETVWVGTTLAIILEYFTPDTHKQLVRLRIRADGKYGKDLTPQRVKVSNVEEINKIHVVASLREAISSSSRGLLRGALCHSQ